MQNVGCLEGKGFHFLYLISRKAFYIETFNLIIEENKKAIFKRRCFIEIEIFKFLKFHEPIPPPSSKRNSEIVKRKWNVLCTLINAT